MTEYDAEAATSWARKSVKEGIDPLEMVDALTEAIRGVGDAYGRGELWLPDMVGAAHAMRSAMAILDEAIERKGVKRPSLGTVVVGTVYGDIHDIGKTIVCALLVAEGFTVRDLGVNVTAVKFMDEIRKYKPDILAMSALMTMTISEMKKVLDLLEDSGLRDKVKVMVGGGGVTKQFADNIGADGYAPTAAEGAKLARSLLGEISVE